MKLGRLEPIILVAHVVDESAGSVLELAGVILVLEERLLRVSDLRSQYEEVGWGRGYGARKWR